ncbi:response regulator transcription factor [Salisediminibacterium selenitireducens]|uniref:Two component transcriptional regulator, LuxR family n=1 Tax=Bacillus selenitireducens (strain ATCC 700615 / DSM 15326 / MLS10) TaxID=439292 RepID=D6XT48_BACIE|nr:response regulator transcription factor [Salisediminibacterium selenitireducens]ADH98984.1 two component transcriptional regulator, LuxR family [[Bacillus] selenitireducens MLS10]
MKIAIIDPQEVTREGLIKVLNESYLIDRCDTFHSPEAFQSRSHSEPIDLLITEICMPTPLDGLAFLDGLEANRDTQISHKVVFSYCEDRLFEQQVKDRSIQGYLCKQMTKETIIEGLDSIMSGDEYFPNKSCSSRSAGTSSFPLTDREKDVFTMLVKGYAYKEISSLYQMSVHTVETHRQNISKKLGKSSRHEWFELAKQFKLI